MGLATLRRYRQSVADVEQAIQAAADLEITKLKLATGQKVELGSKDLEALSPALVEADKDATADPAVTKTKKK